ncbi:PilN domain-containing protein [Massilia sp. TN1-12]|uniref:PilN domain-containing protein n=1 Tax=Massilia paldalensis TaxID=3377675 RepID=UPI00384A815F
MKKVRIDFAPPGLRRALLRAPHAWSAIVAALVLVVPLTTSVLHYREELREHASRVERVEARARAEAPRPKAPPTPVPAAQAGAVNAAVLQLNLPWRGLHDAVQAATPPTVALLALEPDAKKCSLRITAEAKGSDDMIAYVEALQRLDWFDAVALVRHEINEQDPNRPIRFQVDAQWRAAP